MKQGEGFNYRTTIQEVNGFNYLALTVLDEWGVDSPSQAQIDEAEQLVKSIVVLSESTPSLSYRLRERTDFVVNVLDLVTKWHD